MAKKLTKKEKFKKILNLIKRHGKVVAVFKEDAGAYSIEQSHFYRRRKIDKSGRCFVSYYSAQDRKWTEYATSCFIHSDRNKTLSSTIKKMSSHDRGYLDPSHVIVGRKRINL